jgi:GH24 family phage-related lysozyme (muramidase)
MATLILDAAGYQFIRDREGLSLTVKGDTGAHQEIGYGHDLLPVESYPDGITQPYAEALLQADAARDQVHVNSVVPSTCTQNQFDALVDFCYECGPGALQQLIAHGWSQVTAQLPRWVYAKINGVEIELPGMVTRRQLEVQLFNSPVPTSQASA